MADSAPPGTGRSTTALFARAVAHASGRGAEFSPELAVEWLEKAAAAGHPLATDILAQLKREPDATCAFLRKDVPASVEGTLPPLDTELRALVATALEAGPNHPLRLIYAARPVYPPPERTTAAAGDVQLQFRVDAGGHPQELQLVETPDPAFADAALAAVRQWRFVPTLRAAAAADTVVTVCIRFHGNDAPRGAAPR